MKNIYKKLITILLTAIYLFSAVSPTYAVAQYLYDANGNMTSNGQNCYEYNDYNQLKKVKTCSDNKLIAEYGYNSEGQRQIKKEYDTNGNLKWTITSISDKFEVKEYPDGREEITKYYFVNDQLIAKKNPDGTKEYSHNDHLGSTNLTTDQSGQKIEETQYDPWGEVKAGGTKSKFQYTGQEKDPETGLNYYNARYYDSHTKHFTQPDDIVQDPYDPQTLNRYSYVKNNPLKYTDPSGHNVITFFLGAITLAAAFIMPAIVKFPIQPKTNYTPVVNTVKSYNQIFSPATQYIQAVTVLSQAKAIASPIVSQTLNTIKNITNTVSKQTTINATPNIQIDSNRNPKQDKKLTRQEIEKLQKGGEDIEGLKKYIEGGPSKGDLFKNPKTGDIYVKPKSGSGPGEPTNLNINNY